METGHPAEIFRGADMEALSIDVVEIIANSNPGNSKIYNFKKEEIIK